MKKLLLILHCIALLAIGTIPAFAIKVDPKIQIMRNGAEIISYSTLASAVNAAQDGDVISVASEVLSYTSTENINVTKNITLKTGEYFSGSSKYIQYNGTSAPLFTVKNGAALTVADSIIYGNTNSANTNGGLIRVENGGKLIIDGSTSISGFKLNAQGSKGGVIFASNGGKVIVNSVTFSGNFAVEGKDIYAENKDDVTIKSGVVADIAYGESVDINALNLVLSGDIGLVFHTVVPDKYTDGYFVLTCRTGKTVKKNIKECIKDSDGRYIIEYNPSAVELSEKITLTVFDKDGNSLTSKAKSVEDYANTLLSEKSTTQKERNVITKLLNYGHFAQIDCAAANGLTLGTDIAKTAKYADLTVSENVFDNFAGKVEGKDNSVGSIALQLSLAYKPGINICLKVNSVPKVTINGKRIDAKSYDDEQYNCIIDMEGIGIANLAKEYTVCINDKLTLTFSPLTYCWLSKKNGGDSLDAEKALYEFYLATVDYNKL